LGSDAFWTVGPGGQNLLVADAEVVAQVVHRWKDFPKPVQAYTSLRVYGQNVVTAEGPTWQRHRKITGPPFNERNNRYLTLISSREKNTNMYSLVFRETLAQAKAMLASFTHDARGYESTAGQEPTVEDLLRWTMTITLHVISGAGFNLKMAWPFSSVTDSDLPAKPSKTDVEKQSITFKMTQKHNLSFQESVTAITVYLPFICFVPANMLRYSPFRIMRDALRASDDFVAYMREMIAEAQSPSAMAEAATAKERDDTLSSGKADLLGTIVRAGKSDSNMVLNEEETIGNIFIFIMAGHETTASALQVALLLLATHPNIQQKVQAEIDGIWAAKDPCEDLSYGDYPKMRTIMAVMLEALRLFPAIALIPKVTNSAPQTLKMGDYEIHVPTSTTVSIDTIGLHRNTKYWGPDPHEFRPSRWLMAPGYTQPKDTVNESTAHSDLLCPVKGSYMAFSGGFRACLGKKFAQVEFCCLVAVLLKDHSIELVKENGRSWEETRRKAEMDMNARRSGLAMRMQKKIKVRFVKRGTEAFPPRG